MIDEGKFRQFLGDALAHIYEPAYLLAHPLARLLLSAGLVQTPGELSRYLTAAIEELRPPGSVPLGSAGMRHYRYLYLRYVEVWGHRQIAEELGLSTRQTTREHEHGLAALGGLLWNRYLVHANQRFARPNSPTEPAAVSRQLDAGLVEFANPAPTGPVSLEGIVDAALATVVRLADAANVNLCTHVTTGLSPVVVSKVTLRHVLLNLLDYLISRSRSGARLDISASEQLGTINLLLSLDAVQSAPTSPARGSDGQSEMLLARQLAGVIGVQLDLQVSADDIQIVLAVPTRREQTVLYVDDNPDMGRLFRQYLAGTGYGLIHVRSAERAVHLVRANPPDIIILDVILPAVDGWQLLERLRAEPVTEGVPVIMCSILPEQSLAASLGVADVLSKPITQQALLSTLTHWCPLD